MSLAYTLTSINYEKLSYTETRFSCQPIQVPEEINMRNLNNDLEKGQRTIDVDRSLLYSLWFMFTLMNSKETDIALGLIRPPSTPPRF